jgi:hypothetical protein
VNWKSFKTPLKLGVGGTFNDVKTNNLASASSLQELLEKSEVIINTKNVNSKNPGRDAKLVSFFFEKMEGKDINAKVISLNGDSLSGKVIISVLMNGVTKEVPMKYTVNTEHFEAKGVLDVADFSALPALDSINKACFALHQGKTWQDVEIAFSFTMKKSCKH